MPDAAAAPPPRPLVLSATFGKARPGDGGPPVIRIELGNLAPGARIEAVKLKTELRGSFEAGALTLELLDLDEPSRRGAVILSAEQARSAGLAIGDRLLLKQVDGEGRSSHPVEVTLAPVEHREPDRFGNSRFLDQSKPPSFDLDEPPSERGPLPPLLGEGDEIAPPAPPSTEPKPAAESAPKGSVGSEEDGVVSWK